MFFCALGGRRGRARRVSHSYEGVLGRQTLVSGHRASVSDVDMSRRRLITLGREMLKGCLAEGEYGQHRGLVRVYVNWARWMFAQADETGYDWRGGGIDRWSIEVPSTFGADRLATVPPAGPL